MTTFSYLVLVKSGSESSISETCDNVNESLKLTDKESEKNDDHKDNMDTRKEALEVPKANMSKRGSLTSAKSLHELKHETEKTSRNACVEGTKSEDDTSATKGIRPSKSDTSLTETFVVIDNEYNKRKNQNTLREGNCKSLRQEYKMFTSHFIFRF